MASEHAGRPRVRQSSFRKMINEILDERGRDKLCRSLPSQDGFGRIPMEVNCFWARLFSQHFVAEVPEELRDDLLFFIHRKQPTSRQDRQQARLEVFRQDSKNLPSLGEPNIDWEETVYLNLILQQYNYILTCAVCIKSEGTLTILRKHTEQVFASPSRRRMDSKGEESEVSYPNIFFIIDNFDEIFGDFTVQEGQMFCVELVASEKQGPFRSVVFLGSVRHEALKKVYDNRASVSSKVASKVSLGFFQGGRGRVEFIRMRGPEGKGFAEVAVSRASWSSSVESSTEDVHSASESFDSTNDGPSTSSSSLPRDVIIGSPIHKGLRKSQSDSETLSTLTNGKDEEAACQSEDEGPPSSWSRRWMRRTSDALLRLTMRSTQVPALNVHLTYVTLPWHRIIADVLEVKKKPVLS
ncbi:uncharacterized protein KIAA0930 homolog [Lytechinus variegatus]|uniref:uncharacterized protein KIAA0930 homolog n=1 Tax=Lytechinus variegatus TaxID=7654 RepID=UPI001BB1D22C|nr:uncharacterized protein KIAA0930 homolog [Lytechinus variegatus]XP_041472878.1 uncharacterized protein KIAA0930 homolog [Lytechinus variegatus]